MSSNVVAWWALGQASGARRVDGQAREPPHADELIGTRRHHRAAHLLVRFVGNRAELQHVAQDDDQPAGDAARRAATVSRAARTETGIRVVGVVEDAHAARVAPHAATRHRPRLRETAGDLLERPAERDAGAGRGERVRHVVPSGEGQR